LNVLYKEVRYEELVEKCPHVPDNLPKNKPLRMLRIGDYPPMPDGGIHVKSTGEIDKLIITKIENVNNETTVYYEVQ